MSRDFGIDVSRLFPMPRLGPMYDGPIYPGNGYPQNPGEQRPGLSPFGRLAKGQPLGKSSLLFYNGGSPDVQVAESTILTVEGDDLDACQMCITLAPPRVIPLPLSVARALENATGEQLNSQVSDANFPGTSSPVIWPPLEAKIEWGIKGASATAVVDYVNGVTINVIASYVRVHALVSQSLQSGDINGSSAAYYLSAFAGPGWTKTGTAQRTVFVGAMLDGDQSATFDVPRFARRAYVLGATAVTPPVLMAGYLRFWQDTAASKNVGNVFVSSNSTSAVDIPSGAMYFSVYNQSGANMSNMLVVFELSI